MEDICQSEGSTSSIICESDTAPENTSTSGSSTFSASTIDSSVTPSDLVTPADPTHKYEILMTGPNQPRECCFPKHTFSNGNLLFTTCQWPRIGLNTHHQSIECFTFHVIYLMMVHLHKYGFQNWKKGVEKMKCTKVLGTLTRIYENEHVYIFN